MNNSIFLRGGTGDSGPYAPALREKAIDRPLPTANCHLGFGSRLGA